MPVVQVPAFKGPNGMPVGLALVAGRYCDRDLLGVAEVLGGLLVDGGNA
jgi:amidase